jgi:hypothetical protein
MKNTQQQQTKAIVELALLEGGRFVGIRGYENSKGEVSNVVINGKFGYKEAKERDIATLKNFPENVAFSYGDFSLSELKLAKEKLLESLTKPSQTRSQAQIDAYTYLCDGVKIHNATKEIHVVGLLVKKEIVKQGNYKPVNSRRLTLAKKHLSRELRLSTDRIRQYKFSNMNGLKLNGIEIPM